MSVNGTVTTGPNGMTATARKAGIADNSGARMKTTLSTAFGTMSSFSISLTPSARLCSRPKGPCTLGPMRCCIRATTRRSSQMMNSVITNRITKASTTLITMIHQRS